MNQTIKTALHTAGLSIAAAIATGVIMVGAAEVSAVVPVLKSGSFHIGHVISDTFFPVAAKAVGTCLETAWGVAVTYLGKVALFGSHQKRSPTTSL